MISGAREREGLIGNGIMEPEETIGAEAPTGPEAPKAELNALVALLSRAAE
jgi:hypothetical protein